jgi:hypothetical protein
MSNIGLNTNTFRVTGKYLDMLNDYMVKAKIHPINDLKKEQLIDFLLKINDVNNTETKFQLLSSIIERELRNSNNRHPETFLQTLLDEIRNDQVDNVLPKIEFIVEALDTENSEALAKMKGD